MSKMKILYLSDVEFFKGGAERSLFDLMRNPEVEPHLIVPCQGAISEAAQKENIKFHILDFGNVLNVRRPFKLRDIIKTFSAALKAARSIEKISRKAGAKIIHTNGLKAHGVACLSRLLGGPKVVIHFRAIPFTKNEMIFWKSVQLIASKVILVSRPCWPGNSLPRNVQVVFNAIRIPDPALLPERPQQPPFILGFVGRIQFTKGLDTLVEWFEHAFRNGLDIKLVIRGEPAPDELEYLEMIKKMITDKDLEDRCVFEGRVEGFEKIYGHIHANVVSSVTPDPLPRSVMEASALGIPVIGYPAGGIPYMFEDKKSGFLVQTKEEFYEVVKNLMSDSELYNSISQNAIENAKTKFVMERLHSEVTNIYRDISG
jgi:glycosyltransferase involved in cell wall biosynthesis